jgi:hypothetical protein
MGLGEVRSLLEGKVKVKLKDKPKPVFKKDKKVKKDKKYGTSGKV